MIKCEGRRWRRCRALLMSLIQLSGAQDLLQLSPCSLNYPLTPPSHPLSPLQPAATVRLLPPSPPASLPEVYCDARGPK